MIQEDEALRVEAEVAKLYARIPETVRTKEAELDAEERRLANFVDFIGEGRGSQALDKALAETERKVETLREELQGLRRGSEKVFPAPAGRVDRGAARRMQEVLERRTERSALLSCAHCWERSSWSRRKARSGGPTT